MYYTLFGDDEGERYYPVKSGKIYKVCVTAFDYDFQRPEWEEFLEVTSCMFIYTIAAPVPQVNMDYTENKNTFLDIFKPVSAARPSVGRSDWV